MYILTEETVFLPFQLQVLELRDGAVAHVTAFFDLALFPLFGLPDAITEDAASPAPAP